MEHNVSQLKVFTEHCHDTIVIVEEALGSDDMQWYGIAQDVEMPGDPTVDEWIREAELIDTLDVYIAEKNYPDAIQLILQESYLGDRAGTKLTAKVGSVARIEYTGVPSVCRYVNGQQH